MEHHSSITPVLPIACRVTPVGYDHQQEITTKMTRQLEHDHDYQLETQITPVAALPVM